MEPLAIRNDVGRWGTGIVEPRSPPMALDVWTSAPRQGASLCLFSARLVMLDVW